MLDDGYIGRCSAPDAYTTLGVRCCGCIHTYTVEGGIEAFTNSFVVRLIYFFVIVTYLYYFHYSQNSIYLLQNIQ